MFVRVIHMQQIGLHLRAASRRSRKVMFSEVGVIILVRPVLIYRDETLLCLQVDPIRRHERRALVRIENVVVQKDDGAFQVLDDGSLIVRSRTQNAEMAKFHATSVHRLALNTNIIWPARAGIVSIFAKRIKHGLRAELPNEIFELLGGFPRREDPTLFAMRRHPRFESLGMDFPVEHEAVVKVEKHSDCWIGDGAEDLHHPLDTVDTVVNATNVPDVPELLHDHDPVHGGLGLLGHHAVRAAARTRPDRGMATRTDDLIEGVGSRLNGVARFGAYTAE